MAKLIKLEQGGNTGSPYINYFGNVAYTTTPIEYLGLPLEEIKGANTEIRNRYLANKAKADELDILAENTPVLEEDLPHKQNAIGNIRNKLSTVESQDIYDKGDAIIGSAVKGFVTDKALNLAVNNNLIDQQFQEELSVNKDLSAKQKDDFYMYERSKYKGVQVSPNGIVTGNYSPNKPAPYVNRNDIANKAIEGWKESQDNIGGGIREIKEGIIYYNDGKHKYIEETDIIPFVNNYLKEHQGLQAWKNTENVLDEVDSNKALNEIYTAGYDIDLESGTISKDYTDNKGNVVKQKLASILDNEGKLDSRAISDIRDAIAAGNMANKWGFRADDVTNKMLVDSIYGIRLKHGLENEMIRGTGSEMLNTKEGTVTNDIIPNAATINFGKLAKLDVNDLSSTANILNKAGITKSHLDVIRKDLDNGDTSTMEQLVRNLAQLDPKSNSYYWNLLDKQDPNEIQKDKDFLKVLDDATSEEGRLLGMTRDNPKAKNVINITKSIVGVDSWNSMNDEDKKKSINNYIDAKERQGSQIRLVTYDPTSKGQYESNKRETAYLFGIPAQDGTLSSDKIASNLQNRRVFDFDTKEEISIDKLELDSKNNIVAFGGTMDDDNPFGANYKVGYINNKKYIISPTADESVDNLGWAIYGANRTVSGIGDIVNTPHGTVQSTTEVDDTGNIKYKIKLNSSKDGNTYMAEGTNLVELHDAIIKGLPVLKPVQ